MELPVSLIKKNLGYRITALSPSGETVSSNLFTGEELLVEFIDEATTLVKDVCPDGSGICGAVVTGNRSGTAGFWLRADCILENCPREHANLSGNANTAST